MPYIDDKTYDSLAKQAVDAFINDNTPLGDSVYKIAEDMGMLPDQVKQLAWRSNTLAHLTLFEKKAEDKNIEFPVVNAEEVLKKLYNSTEEKTAEAYTSKAKERVVDFYSPLHEEEFTKEASAYTPLPPFSQEIAKDSTDEKRERAVFIMHKVAEELETRVVQHRDKYLEDVITLGEELRKLANNPLRDFEVPEFVHEAVTVHGKTAEHILKELNIEVKDSMRKTAALADTETTLHKLLSSAIHHRKEAFKAANALKLLKKDQTN